MVGTAARLAPTLALAAALACAAPPQPPPAPPPEPVQAFSPEPEPAEVRERPATEPARPAPPAAPDPSAAERARLDALAASLRGATDESDPARAAERARLGLAEALPHLERERGGEDPLVRDLADTLRDLEALAAEREQAEQRLARRRHAAELTRSGLDLAAAGDSDAAIATLERAVALHEAEAGPDGARALGASLSYLGRLRADRGDAEATALLERSLSLLEPALGRLDPLTLATRARLERLRAGAPPAARPD